MKGKWMLEIIIRIYTAAHHMLINSMRNEKPLDNESNAPPLICYVSHFWKQ
jgi:hypothetical protein